MATVRIVITLKPGVLDAQGQAVLQGLQALGYAVVSDVRVGRYVEITVPDGFSAEEIGQMCERFLANPLIEQWRFETSGVRGSGSGVRDQGPRSRVPQFPRSRESH